MLKLDEFEFSRIANRSKFSLNIAYSALDQRIEALGHKPDSIIMGHKDRNDYRFCISKSPLYPKSTAKDFK